MPTECDSYKHLNETDKFTMSMDIEEVAAKIVGMNYGVHRLLSAIVWQILSSRPDDKLALGIKKLLDSGLY